MLTSDQLRAIMPHLSVAKHATLLPALNAAAPEFGFESPARLAAFLAQVAHESAEFRFMEEIWGPTAAQQRYEPQSSLAQSLGNTASGDGKRFKGRGVIQLTGRANYRKFGGLLGVDLEADPQRAATPALVFRIAGLFWQKKGLNELADRGTSDAFREITRRINGGFNGLAERERFYAVALRTLDVPVAFETLEPSGAEEEGLQESEPTFGRGWEAITDETGGRDRGVRPPTRQKRLSRTRSGKTPRQRAVARRIRGKTRPTTVPRGASKKTATRKSALRKRSPGRAAPRPVATRSRSAKQGQPPKPASKKR